MKHKLSQWHDGSVKPVHVGVYETDIEPSTFQFWNGEFWGYCGVNPSSAYSGKRFKSAHQYGKWRGILK